MSNLFKIYVLLAAQLFTVGTLSALPGNWGLSFGYHGISVDKGIQLRLHTPNWLGKHSSLFIEGSLLETAGILPGEPEFVHERYLLAHAGWRWAAPITGGLAWTGHFGVGINLPLGLLDDTTTPTGIVRSGLAYLLPGSTGISAYLDFGLEINFWNRAGGFEGNPYFGRGTSVAFGLELSL